MNSLEHYLASTTSKWCPTPKMGIAIDFKISDIVLVSPTSKDFHDISLILLVKNWPLLVIEVLYINKQQLTYLNCHLITTPHYYIDNIICMYICMRYTNMYINSFSYTLTLSFQFLTPL